MQRDQDKSIDGQPKASLIQPRRYYGDSGGKMGHRGPKIGCFKRHVLSPPIAFYLVVE
jgi:hypothetical protein